MQDNPYMMLAKVFLPSVMTEYFDLVDVRTDEYGGEPRVHIYLDEKEVAPEGCPNASPNGFYEESCMNHFPINEYRTILHVRRRRWKDAEGKSVSKDWQLVADGTRYSKEFAAFLKEFVGYIPDYARSLQKPYHIKGDEFERAYKDRLSDFRTWKHKSHAQKWLVFPRNIGPNFSIDETALSNGDLYTIIPNKDAHGRKGALVAIVSGTKVEDVVEAVMHIHRYLRCKVREVTMDFSEGMHQIVMKCFPYVTITLDRFHMQQLVTDAMQELRLKHKKEEQMAQNEQRKLFKEQLKEKYEKVKAFGNDSFNTAADTIRDREDEVLNYFIHRATNASAESLNSKIKQFRAQLRGVADVDFFLCRLSMIFG